MEHICIRAFRAVDERDSCVRYVMEHARVLSDLGVSSAVPKDDSWALDPGVIVVVAMHERLGMVAGVRLQTNRPGSKLPFELGLTRARDLPNMPVLLPTNSAELCGLWNAHRFAGKGLPWLLTSAAVSVSHNMDIDALVCFAAQYTKKYPMMHGFRLMTEVGDAGSFRYPVESITSYLLINRDLQGLSTAEPSLREIMLSLRLSPEQIRIEHPAKEGLVVSYELLFDRDVLYLSHWNDLGKKRRQKYA